MKRQKRKPNPTNPSRTSNIIVHYLEYTNNNVCYARSPYGTKATENKDDVTCLTCMFTLNRNDDKSTEDQKKWRSICERMGVKFIEIRDKYEAEKEIKEYIKWAQS